MQNTHGHTWECRSPAHEYIVFEQEILYQQHSITEHGVSEEIAATLSNVTRRPGTERVKGCPFGDDFQGPDKAESSSGSLIFSSEALQLHVAAHIKEIALLTLQKLPSNDDEDADNVGSDLASEAEGPPQKRASMYSILDDEDFDYDEDGVAAADSRSSDGEEEEEINAGVKMLDLEDMNKSGMTKLHCAVQAGDLRLAQSLIQEGASVISSRDKNNRTALHYAAMERSDIGLEMVRLLSDVGGQALVNLGDESGQTALHYATERGLAESFRVMLEHGADVTVTDNEGFSPWLWAVVAGQLDQASALLTSGMADVNASSVDGRTALGWAAGLGWSSIAQLLIAHNASLCQDQNAQISPLEDAAAVGNLDTVRLLLDVGADPNFRGRDGWSALHWAAEESHFEVVQMLLDAGANVNAVSSYGTTPLHCAANGGLVSIINLLLQERADPLRITCHGWTALHHAAFMGHSHVIQRLLEDERIKTSAAQQDNHGWSVLHLAVHSRDLTTIEILLGGGFITDPQALLDESGLSAEDWLSLRPGSHLYRATSNLAVGKSRCCRATTGLRQAVVTGSVPMIRLLINSGHNIDGTDSRRRTALYYAAKNGMLGIMDLLLEMGANHSILPAGRRTWEEFIPSRETILRLNRAGYRTQGGQGTDPEVNSQIKHALRPKRFQRSAQGRSVAFALDEPTSTSPRSDRSAFTPTFNQSPFTPTFNQSPFTPSERSFPTSPAPLAPLSPDPSASARSPPLPSSEIKDNKRKTDRSGKKFWKMFKS
jgi:ankyrin repeat protein